MVTERKQKVRELDSPYMKQQEIHSNEKKRKRKGLVRRLTVLGVASFVIGIFTLMTIHTQAKTLDEKREQRLALEQNLKLLEDEQHVLLEEIENYNSLEYIAEVARRDYYLSKPGETIFKLPQAPTD
ncbi:FtsB family cell division protein [Bacillus sp. FJAT-45350]|uniref:FtsB family cell division protein n=1 Tax=Bacillus sp. FJAT-45350 TaxID=2011014 RepID=UPI000BB6B17C|nr:septum formation initiator family protein [Bacillus sp. FJAT-45350]